MYHFQLWQSRRDAKWYWRLSYKHKQYDDGEIIAVTPGIGHATQEQALTQMWRVMRAPNTTKYKIIDDPNP